MQMRLLQSFIMLHVSLPSPPSLSLLALCARRCRSCDGAKGNKRGPENEERCRLRVCIVRYTCADFPPPLCLSRNFGLSCPSFSLGGPV